MKKLFSLITLVGLASALSGCAIAGPGIVNGGLFSSYTLGSAGTQARGEKSGEACAMSILGIVGVGDASIDDAARNGGITNVATVDHKAFSILGIYANVCTIVTGN